MQRPPTREYCPVQQGDSIVAAPSPRRRQILRPRRRSRDGALRRQQSTCMRRVATMDSAAVGIQTRGAARPWWRLLRDFEPDLHAAGARARPVRGQLDAALASTLTRRGAALDPNVGFRQRREVYECAGPSPSNAYRTPPYARGDGAPAQLAEASDCAGSSPRRGAAAGGYVTAFTPGFTARPSPATSATHRGGTDGSSPRATHSPATAPEGARSDT